MDHYCASPDSGLVLSWIKRLFFVVVIYDTQALAREGTQAFQRVYGTLLRSHLFALKEIISQVD